MPNPYRDGLLTAGQVIDQYRATAAKAKAYDALTESLSGILSDADRYSLPVPAYQVRDALRAAQDVYSRVLQVGTTRADT